MNTRLLGWVLLFTSVIVMLAGFRETALGIDDPSADPLSGTAYALWGIGGICGVLGLIQLNALGSNAVARALGFLPMLGFAAFVLGNGFITLGFIRPEGPVFTAVVSIAWITMLAGMLVVGILTIAAKTWTGWRRFLPLFTIIMFPVGSGIGQAIGNLDIGGVLAFVPWMLLGYVIATAEPAPSVQPGVLA